MSALVLDLISLGIFLVQCWFLGLRREIAMGCSSNFKFVSASLEEKRKTFERKGGGGLFESWKRHPWKRHAAKH
jgi:hypothetical protein